MRDRRRILMLVNWELRRSTEDMPDEQPSNKVIEGERYWFFRYWNDDFDLDVVDSTRLRMLHPIEKRFLKFYVSQAVKVLPELDGYDLIISHSAQSGLLLAFMRSLEGKKFPPHIIIDPGSFNGGRSRIGEILPIRFSLPSVAGIIGHSKSQVEYYSRTLSIPPERYRIVRVGVDAEFYSPLEVGGREDYVVCLGYMKRDWETLLSAWRSVRSSSSLLILGRVGLEEPSERIRCMPYVSRSTLREVIAGARFVVIPLPYHTYSFGQMSLLISQAMAKAVVVTGVPGLLDYARDGENVLFVKPYDSREMRDKIELLLSEPARAASMGRRGRESVVQHYTERHMGLELKRAVDELSRNV